MQLSAITIEPQDGEPESLAVCMRAIARAAGVELDYDTLCAAMGVSLAALAHPAGESPAGWSGHGSDAFFAPAVRLFGWQVRDLHPPDVGLGMLEAEEFPQHFELSYQPLIRRALENGQPVLAWRGWEGAPPATWGVITEWRDQAFWGVSPHRAGAVRLAAPAMQCYVVEQREPATPPSGEVLAAAMSHAHAYLTQAEVPGRRPPALLAGTAVYDRWLAWLAGQPPAPDEVPASLEHSGFACRISAARLSAWRFLASADAVRSPGHAAGIDALAECCEEVADELLPACLPERLNALWRTAPGHEALQDDLRSARTAEALMAEQVRELAAPVA